MRVRVIAQTPSDFSRWEQTQLQVPPIPAAGDAAWARKTFNSGAVPVVTPFAARMRTLELARI